MIPPRKVRIIKLRITNGWLCLLPASDPKPGVEYDSVHCSTFTEAIRLFDAYVAALTGPARRVQ